MIKVEDFRAGREGVPFSCVDEIPGMLFSLQFSGVPGGGLLFAVLFLRV